ncbi:CHASE domain-containing protein [Motiliproteus sediminis]|uniref:CHASE domain-containing protein n=1 Tax=Motiliproteus sediminis TaxID=1468178 RepID=UPI001AF0213F|nr:CHASE domain-containing protein [Motiliproteus sediminis]
MSAAWSVVTCFFLGLLLLLDISGHRESLQLESSIVYEYTYERALINEVILHNFVELVETDLNNFEAIRRYAKDMREHYPHVLQFQLLRRVEERQVAAFEQEMRDRGFPDYRVHGFERGASGTEPGDVLYPVFFVEPLDARGERLLGLDSYSVASNRTALIQASYYLDVFASDPYALSDGEVGYRLFHATDPARSANKDNLSYVVTLVIRANELLPPLPHLSEGLRVTLYDGMGNELLQRRDRSSEDWEGLLLPVIADQRTINRFGQVLDVLVEKQLRWSEMSWPFGLVVVLFSVFSYFFTQQSYLRKKDAERELIRVNEKLRLERDLLEDRVQERTWELVKANSELRRQVKENRSLTQKILSIQEEERRNIARELHDEMGQSLTAIRTDSHLLKKLTSKDSKSLLHQAAASIDATAQRIYGVTYGLMRALRPSALDDLGLVDAIKGCVATFHLDSIGVELHLSIKGALNELPEDLNISCYRLVQEALNNCVKHAEASNIWLRIERLEDPEDRLFISIEDDGKGFDWRSNATGFGLIGMRERALAQDGDFKLRSSPGQGAHIEVSLPVGDQVTPAHLV